MKKIPLRYYFWAGCGLMLLAVGVFIVFRILSNHNYVEAYNRGQYNTRQEEGLLTLNIPEGYVPYYNLGNAYYKMGDYNSAIGYYNQALLQHPAEPKDCQIRINLALAMLGTIDFYGLNTQEKIDTALFMLYKARDVLTENGCASEEGHDGHNADAQQLKEDIDRLIEQLENQDSSGSSNNQDEQSDSSDNSDSSGNESKPSEREKRVQGELEEKKKDALEDRKGQQEQIEKWSGNVGGDGEDDGDGDGTGNSKIDPW